MTHMIMNLQESDKVPDKKQSLWGTLTKDLSTNRYIYIMLIPAIVYYFIFCYKPMYGLIIAFKDYKPMLGILKSPWVGLEQFKELFSSIYFVTAFKNTLLISFLQLIFAFPAPIILSLLLNEVRHNVFKRTVQSISYIPHFISIVVVCGLIKIFTKSDGAINDIIAFFGGGRSSMLLSPELFRPIYILSEIWQNVGWGMIIYLAALTSIENELYEASTIDGAGRFKQLIYITLPGIMPTVVVMLILQLGMIMNVGFEKIMLLYNPMTYSTADVISTLVYRKGIQEFSYSFSTAVGFFNSVINFTLVVSSNWLSKRLNNSSLW